MPRSVNGIEFELFKWKLTFFFILVLNKCEIGLISWVDLWEMKKQRESSIRWLQNNVAGIFWEWTHERLCEINLENREALIWINRSMGYKELKSFRKILSWAGSIRLPNEIPDKLVTWKDEKLKERHLEPGNRVYRNAFRAAWPRVLPEITNVESIGDLLEAFFSCRLDVSLEWSEGPR